MKIRCRFSAVMFCLVIVFLFHGSSLANGNNKRKFSVEIGKADTNEILFLKVQGNVKEESIAAEAIGNEYIAASEPNDFIIDMDELPDLQVIDPNVVTEAIESDNSINDKKLKKDDVLRYAKYQVRLFANSEGRIREEANIQVQRLWRISLPVLIDNLGNKDSKINDAVMKNLILMRNQKVIRMIIKRIQETDDMNVKYSGAFALGMMKENRKTSVAGRPHISEEESTGLADKTILPFLRKLERESEDATLKKIIQNAYGYLDKPYDLGLKQVEKDKADN